MSAVLTDTDLVNYARWHCRTELALFHANHLRRLLTLAGLPIPSELMRSNGFHPMHEDEMDAVLTAIERATRQPKLVVVPGGKGQ